MKTPQVQRHTTEKSAPPENAHPGNGRELKFPTTYSTQNFIGKSPNGVELKQKETGMPAYVIIQQKALLGMVNLLPNDAESLEAVPYFGHKGGRELWFGTSGNYPELYERTKSATP